jgi:hypothetical protein
VNVETDSGIVHSLRNRQVFRPWRAWRPRSVPWCRSREEVLTVPGGGPNTARGSTVTTRPASRALWTGAYRRPAGGTTRGWAGRPPRGAPGG